VGGNQLGVNQWGGNQWGGNRVLTNLVVTSWVVTNWVVTNQGFVQTWALSKLLFREIEAPLLTKLKTGLSHPFICRVLVGQSVERLSCYLVYYEGVGLSTSKYKIACCGLTKSVWHPMPSVQIGW